MNNKIPQVKNLIFSGGGAAGVAFAGAVEELCKQPGFSLDTLINIAGTSIGSIAALMVSLNYNAAEMMQKMTTIDLSKLEDGGWLPSKVIRLYSEYGVYRGMELYKLILDLIREKTGRLDPDKVTFADLNKLHCKNLYVVATKLYTLNGRPTGKRKVFSAEKTPQTAVASAILASCAAPFYFERVRLKKIAKGEYVLSEDGELYNDGGLVKNLALDLFDKAKYIEGSKYDPETHVINPESLGLSLLSADEIVDPWHIPKKGGIADKSPVVWSTALYHAITSRDEIDGEEKSKYHERTVQIDRLNVSLGDFGIDHKTKMALVDSARLGVRHYYEALENKDAYDMHKLKAANDFANHKVPNGGLWKEKAKESKSEPAMKPSIVFVQR